MWLKLKPSSGDDDERKKTIIRAILLVKFYNDGQISQLSLDAQRKRLSRKNKSYESPLCDEVRLINRL